MSSIKISIPTYLDSFIKEMIDDKYAKNKTGVIRKALLKLREDEAVNSVLRAEQEIREGKLLEGDLDGLANKYR